jgi:hypothetical protein
MRRCPTCGSELGPLESRLGCITCRGRKRVAFKNLIYPSLSLADRAVASLEQSDISLASWDIRRLIDRGREDPTHPASLMSLLGTDRRFCWAGRGMYGLYRHGLLPGARDLHDVGLFYLFASDRPLDTEELCFVIRNAGYRFTDSSLMVALVRYRAPLDRDHHGRWFINKTEPKCREFMANLIELKAGETFDAVLSRTAEQVRAGLAEMSRRLGPALREGSRAQSIVALGKRVLEEQVVEDVRRKSREPKAFAWPKPPSCAYFDGDTGRVGRVRRRAIAIVEGRAIEPYVATIECRDRYLEACVEAYRQVVYGA